MMTTGTTSINLGHVLEQAQTCGSVKTSQYDLNPIYIQRLIRYKQTIYILYNRAMATCMSNYKANNARSKGQNVPF
jgi:hypothetical protein